MDPIGLENSRVDFTDIAAGTAGDDHFGSAGRVQAGGSVSLELEVRERKRSGERVEDRHRRRGLLPRQCHRQIFTLVGKWAAFLGAQEDVIDLEESNVGVAIRLVVSDRLVVLLSLLFGTNRLSALQTRV